MLVLLRLLPLLLRLLLPLLRLLLPALLLLLLLLHMLWPFGKRRPHISTDGMRHKPGRLLLLMPPRILLRCVILLLPIQSLQRGWRHRRQWRRGRPKRLGLTPLLLLLLQVLPSRVVSRRSGGCRRSRPRSSSRQRRRLADAGAGSLEPAEAAGVAAAAVVAAMGHRGHKAHLVVGGHALAESQELAAPPGQRGRASAWGGGGGGGGGGSGWARAAQS